MRIYKHTVLMLVVFFIYGCQTEKNHLEIETESIGIKIQLSPETKENDGSHNKVYGTVEISNITDQTQNYGNSFLFLVVNDTLSSRTYKDTKTSEFIDFSYVQIAPNASISFSAYWIFDAGKNRKVNSLQVVFDKDKLDDHIKSSTLNPYNRPIN